MNIRQVLHDSKQAGLNRVDAQLLVLHSMGRSLRDRAWLLAHDMEELSTQSYDLFSQNLARLRMGEPLAYITGHQEFYGLDLCVDARVLVPRADTETLVDWALEALANRSEASVLDLGTGSGAIALALKNQRPAWKLSAIDASQDALALAQSNAARLNLEVAFYQGNWFDALPLDPLARFDAIVANPPYIAQNDPHLLALTFEPKTSLTGGADGMTDLRTIVEQAHGHLQTGGWLLLEHGYEQANHVRGLLESKGFEAVQSRRDLAGIERCSGGRL